MVTGAVHHSKKVVTIILLLLLLLVHVGAKSVWLRMAELGPTHCRWCTSPAGMAS